jgi:hypothetical protein
LDSLARYNGRQNILTLQGMKGTQRRIITVMSSLNEIAMDDLGNRLEVGGGGGGGALHRPPANSFYTGQYVKTT